MQLVYFSLTGQTRRFIQKLNHTPTIDLGQNPEAVLKEDFFLFVPTYPDDMMTIVDDFLAEDQNRDHCSGIIGSGNKNFAQDYCFTAYLLGDRYQIPVLYCYEFQGTDQDIIKVKELININGKRSSL